MEEEYLPHAFVVGIMGLTRHPRIELMIEPLDAFFLLSALQLALRHPDCPAGPRVNVERIAHRLVDLIATLEPELRPFCEAGFDPSQDVPR